MNYVFFGTDEFAVKILESLKSCGHIPTSIVCAPDKPERRKKGLVPPTVKLWANEQNINIHQPEKLDSEFVDIISKEKSDLFIVASYGKIIPQYILDIPKKGTLNVHPSLLPKYRGASPVESAILNDDKETGVTVMQMDHLMDHGPIVSQIKHTFTEWPKGTEARLLLAELGGKELCKVLDKFISGEIKVEEQNHNIATYTKKYIKSDALIDLKDDDYSNFLKIQAFYGWYNAYFIANKKGKDIRVVIKDAKYDEGKLEILRVVPEGKSEMDLKQFENFLRN